jgi:electron transport complex protein RnfB
MANGEAGIDQCPPGGQAGVDALATLLGRDSKPLNEAFGTEAPPTVAVIDEDVCIGCTKCIQACPVDAIVGAGKRMHTVIAAECTGCELCIAPCPVDCISMHATSTRVLDRPEVMQRASHARRRYEARMQRIAKERRALAARRSEAKGIERKSEPPISRQAVLDAIARGLARRAAKRPDSTTE